MDSARDRLPRRPQPEPMSAHSINTSRTQLSLRPGWRYAALTLLLLLLSACEQADFRFAGNRPASERFTIPDPPADSPAAGCFDELASADRDVRYCRRQAECRFLATPQASASDISDSVELCLNHRAQQRVAMGL
jgi:hypothetical protein